MTEVIKILGFKPVLRGAMRVYVPLYRLSRGRVLGRMNGVPVLLLTTVGRRSGMERTLPMGYLPDGDRYVIGAGNNGSDRHPGWFWNLQANPNVRVEVGGDEFAAVARVADPEEREVLWDRFEKQHPVLSVYREATDRVIPIVVVTPERDVSGR